MNEQILYKFRFKPSNKLIYLTKEELSRIPLSFTLVEHKNNFLSIENDHNEYLLHYPVSYKWFIPILNSLNTEQAYILFNELSKTENILDVLQLIDYLCIDLFPSPHLDEQNLRLLNPMINKDEKQRLVYRRVN
ncbi:hypothetical protein I4U23_016832 [Adineta vaga]|nr:hypothetical protein I4U23_016832 [Adineta vaga]